MLCSEGCEAVVKVSEFVVMINSVKRHVEKKLQYMSTVIGKVQ